MAKGGSESAAGGLECQEVAGEHRRAVADACRGRARVLRIQTKLHRWATDDPGRRFDDLFNLVADPAFLLVAWDRVRGNRGARSAGVDGETAHYVEACGASRRSSPSCGRELKAGRFTPLPVRERMIPKAERQAAPAGHPDRRGTGWCRPPSSWCSSRSSRRTSSRARTASARGAGPRTRSPRSTCFASPRNYEWVLEA